MTDDQIRKRIAEIEGVLQTGVTSVTTDGETVSIDTQGLQAELSKLRAKLNPHRSRRVRTIDLRNAF
jgi:hypothetical protein